MTGKTVSELVLSFRRFHSCVQLLESMFLDFEIYINYSDKGHRFPVEEGSELKDALGTTYLPMILVLLVKQDTAETAHI